MPDDAPHAAARPGPCGSVAGDVSTTALTGLRSGVDPATERLSRVWCAGEYDRIAAGMQDGAAEFVARRALGPGVRVLDLGCGTGVATVAAAHTGATVTGLDLAAPLLAVARRRAHAAGVQVTFEAGDAEALPYQDGAFESVLSFFGIMFAARPDRVLAELARVTRRGSTVVLAHWTPGGFMGRLHRLLAGAGERAPEAPDAFQWGRPELVREWLDDRAWLVETRMRRLPLVYPAAPAGTAELYRSCYGPAVHAFEALAAAERAALASAMSRLWWRASRDADGTVVEAEFLEVTATRR
jgi:SAM-dependent methyltransferase